MKHIQIGEKEMKHIQIGEKKVKHIQIGERKVKRNAITALSGLILLASPAYAMGDLPEEALDVTHGVASVSIWTTVGIFAFLVLSAWIIWRILRARRASVVRKAGIPKSSRERIARGITDAVGLPSGAMLEEDRHPYLIIPGKRLKRYLDRVYVPRMWHQAVRFAILPLNLIVSLVYLGMYQVGVFNETAAPNALYAPLVAVDAALALIAYIAFFRWNRVGVWCLIAMYGFSAGYQFYLYIVGMAAGSQRLGEVFLTFGYDISSVMSHFAIYVIFPSLAGLFLPVSNPINFIIPFIMTVLLTIYYVKRAPLFLRRYHEIQDALGAVPEPVRPLRHATAMLQKGEPGAHDGASAPEGGTGEHDGEYDEAEAARKRAVLNRLASVMHLPEGTALMEDVYPYLSIPGMRLRRYLDRKHTPLKFHWYLRTVGLLSVVGQAIYNMFDLVEAARIGNVQQTENIVLQSVNMLLLVIAFIAFIRWHRVGVWSYLAGQWVMAAWLFSKALTPLFTVGADVRVTFIYLLVCMIYIPAFTVPCTVYYVKRSLLFSPKYRCIQETLYDKP